MAKAAAEQARTAKTWKVGYNSRSWLDQEEEGMNLSGAVRLSPGNLTGKSKSHFYPLIFGYGLSERGCTACTQYQFSLPLSHSVLFSTPPVLPLQMGGLS